MRVEIEEQDVHWFRLLWNMIIIPSPTSKKPNKTFQLIVHKWINNIRNKLSYYVATIYSAINGIWSGYSRKHINIFLKKW